VEVVVVEVEEAVVEVGQMVVKAGKMAVRVMGALILEMVVAVMFQVPVPLQLLSQVPTHAMRPNCPQLPELLRSQIALGVRWAQSPLSL
jgi:hypothetical protein